MSMYSAIFLHQLNRIIRHRACAYGVLGPLAVRPLHSYLSYLSYFVLIKGPEILRPSTRAPLPGHLPDLLKPHQNPSKTSCSLPRLLWKRQRASWNLRRAFLDLQKSIFPVPGPLKINISGPRTFKINISSPWTSSINISGPWTSKNQYFRSLDL